MDQNNIQLQESQSSKRKLVKLSTIIGVLFIFTYLLLIGVFAFINYKNIEKDQRTSTLFQKGMQIRNSYEGLPVTSIQSISYSQFPHRLLEIHADENTLYSYRDDFYKDFSESNVKVDRNKVVIYLTERQVFDHPLAVAEQPECEAIARIESEKRQPKQYESEPTEVILKYKNKQESDKKVYVYSPELGHCKNVFSDSRLLRVQANANTIRYSF